MKLTVLQMLEFMILKSIPYFSIDSPEGGCIIEENESSDFNADI